MANPYICNCEKYIDTLLEGLDEKVYNKEATDTNLYNIIDTFNRELCEAYADLTYNKNDIYLSRLVEDEIVVHGEQHGIDCFANWSVVEILKVGNTPGANDYIEYIDWIIHPRGIQWGDLPYYYGHYPYGYGYGYGGYGTEWQQYYNPYAPWGRKEPATGDIYYVTYKYGCRDENLYNIFGRLVKLKKIDYQSYPEYRNAIRVLILAYLSGPTINNIKTALSIFHPIDEIVIEEYYNEGWILGEKTLYSEETLADLTQDTSDKIVIRSGTGGYYEWSVTFLNSSTLTTSEKTTLESIIENIKPAHTKVEVFYS